MYDHLLMHSSHIYVLPHIRPYREEQAQPDHLLIVTSCSFDLGHESHLGLWGKGSFAETGLSL